MVLIFDLADSVFIQNSLKKISIISTHCVKNIQTVHAFDGRTVIYTRVDVTGPHNIPMKTVIPSFVKEM